MPTGLAEDKIVSAIEFRPGTPNVVHHAFLDLDTTGGARKIDSLHAGYGYDGNEGSQFSPASVYLGYLPGTLPRVFPKGTGMMMYKGSDLVLDMHYAPLDYATSDKSEVLIYFLKEPLQREVKQNSLIDKELFIPADSTIIWKRSFPASPDNEDISFFGVLPHMHYLGVKAIVYAVTPSNDTIPLVKIDEWDHHWEQYYWLKHPVKMPAGTLIYFEATYDNTANNKKNPYNPPRDCRWGNSTLDEMYLINTFMLSYRPGDELIDMESSALTSVDDNHRSGKDLLAITSYKMIELENELQVECISSLSAVINCLITDITGRTLSQSEHRVQPGESRITIPINGYSSGTYLLTLQHNSYIKHMPVHIIR